jgi:AcrR family transcriptional regulator
VTSSATFVHNPPMARLREQRKARTRQAIVDAALALFDHRRFADVSVDEIAAAAGVGRRTFFRYFPTKEDVVLDSRHLDRNVALEALAQRRPGEDEIFQVMRVLAELQRRTFAHVRPEHQLAVHRLSHFEPALAARSWLLAEKARDLIVDGLLEPDAEPHARLRARVLASACIMAVDAAVTTWIEGGMHDELEALLEEGAGHLRGGFR